MVVMRLEGIEKVTQNFRVAMSAVVEGVENGIENAAQTILDEANTLAPEDTGNLKSSSYYVSARADAKGTPSFNNKRNDATDLRSAYNSTVNTNKAIVNSAVFPTAIISFSAPYANIIHEISRNYTVGQWKFLETALKNNTRTIISKVGAGVMERLR